MRSLIAAARAVYPRISTMHQEAIDNVRRMEKLNAEMPQVPIRTEHVIHAGMYSRTVFLPAGTAITGVLVKIPTLLIIQGDAVVYVGGGAIRITGYAVLPADAGRKQAFIAKSDVHLTMIFPTNAKTVEAAEREFTDEYELLASHRDDLNEIVVTGE